MNKEMIKPFIIGAAITAIILWKWYEMKIETMETSFNEQLALLTETTDSSSETAKKNIEFASIGDDCELIRQFKMSLNYLGGASYFDELPTYSEQDQDMFAPILKNLTHFENEEGALRKAFLYDFNITIANILGVTDFPLREFKYEYTGGVLNKGDKGADIRELQELLNLIKYKKEPREITGTYDRETYDIVVEVFKGTTALIDEGKGTLSKEFINNFSIIISNLTYQYVDNTDLGQP